MRQLAPANATGRERRGDPARAPRCGAAGVRSRSARPAAATATAAAVATAPRAFAAPVARTTAGAGGSRVSPGTGIALVAATTRATGPLRGSDPRGRSDLQPIGDSAERRRRAQPNRDGAVVAVE